MSCREPADRHGGDARGHASHARDSGASRCSQRERQGGAKRQGPPRPAPFFAGTACLALGLWVFHRSHADLGANWSVTLEIRESHRLVTHGIYRAVRHPMYTALLLYSVGQALVVPNWLAGPANLIALLALLMLRLPAEERLMLDTFGGEYSAYMSRTKRLLPGAGDHVLTSAGAV